ncbi:GTP-binding protein [Winogradskyella aurantia]|uniref:GTP-binding protein n=1 Tax=Winogradskyella aurantia TaxID=1915063 RepID=A0A265UUW6_9FLAO|nr:GTP-binding protein [Winogradskyella aurantia]OZV69096.1 GTP-binding protein [Winogradskyella aurantia]
MALPNEIVLRPRFKFDMDISHENLLDLFESKKKSQSEFIISRVDDHVFIKFPKHSQHFWSPQLHLEINESDKNKSIVYGLFGPNPTVWTMFMFLHFVVAGLFIAFGIWAYTNATLGNSYALQLGMTLMMVAFWFVLYFAGRLGRAKGKPEMEALFKFMRKTILSE